LKRGFLGSPLGGLIARYQWNSRFETWADPLSDSAEQKCQNAESVIRSALLNDPVINQLNISVFAQGSYKANTNVKSDNDVDICVRNNEVFVFDLPIGVTAIQAGISGVGSGLRYADFKNYVGNALFQRFGVNGVQRGDKAFRVHENSYRIQADVVPAFDYRLYYQQGAALIFTSGICFYADSGKRIINFPELTLANGRAKNERTGRRYKKVVRIIKGLRYEMEDKGIQSAKRISSFQIACLAYNCPDAFFGSDDLYQDTEQVARHIWYSTQDRSRSANWREVDEIKQLFPGDNPGLPSQVSLFFWDLLTYVGMVGAS
jgi:hypothetical protein